jgi:guanylate kinase
MAAMPSGTSAGKLVLLIGPSGVGKSVILKHLRQTHPEVHFPRSATTRARREGEGDDLYHFVTEAQFDELLNAGKLLEWARVHGGASYGTMEEEIVPQVESGKIVIREVDVQGFESIRTHRLLSGDAPALPLQSIFVLPESEEQLVAHITKRAPIADDELRRRIRSMEKELTYADLCDVKIINKEGKLDETIARIEAEIFGK